jgi:hypothetical protein
MPLGDFLLVFAIPLIAALLVRWLDSVEADDHSKSGLYGEW